MNYVIACHKPWCISLANRINKVTGSQFIIITEKKQLMLQALDEVNPEYIFFPHWSYLIPEEIYSRYECVIFHMTDLPYGRGGSPLQNLIIRGHQETMLSALKCVQEIDSGPVYIKERLSILGSADEIFLRVSRLIESMIITILYEKPDPIEQEGGVTIFSRRTAAQSDWSNAATLDEVFDQIRMLDGDGYPPAFVQIGPYKLEFSRASRKTECIIADVKIIKIRGG
jgi:methionyl-tRNA formyltransferase